MAAPTFAYAIEPLNADRDRSGFSCGKESLDRYLLHRRVKICVAASPLPLSYRTWIVSVLWAITPSVPLALRFRIYHLNW
ncbi:MAG: hypothetical protein KME17_14840 [Cyanosarcina radialis HA8281-LM2]|nr:hypothetical protein [Cyanosarcina radialis HA8281-LM2]